MKRNVNEKNLRQNRGITLIALIITIIVLLILAGVSIAMLTGENGILGRAGQASETTKDVTEDEQVKLVVADALVNGTGTLSTDNLEKALKSEFGEDKVKDNFTGTGPWTFKGERNTYTIETTGKITSTNSTTPPTEEKLAKEVLKIKPEADENTPDYERSPYVKYNNILCRVFYNDEYVDGEHGLQIISADNVGEVTLGNEDDFEESRSDYNNAVDILNNKAKSHMLMADKIAMDARSLGSAATLDGEKFKSGSEFSGSFGGYGCFDGLFVEEDSYYTSDSRQLGLLGLHLTSSATWFASRSFCDGVDVQDWGVSFVGARGVPADEVLCWYSDTVGSWLSRSAKHGYRPVFLLSPDVKVKGGTGAEDDPYELGL